MRQAESVYSLPDPSRKADEAIEAMRARVLAEVERIRLAQQPLARARREKQLLECMARAEAGVARANEIVRRLTQQPVREAA
jgi:hypothetical protein